MENRIGCMVESSFENVKDWYEGLVGKKGHHYHEKVILPKLIPLLQLSPNYKLLDFGCGQGVLSRALKRKGKYLGVDASASLVKEAEKKKTSPTHHFIHHDVTKPMEAVPTDFTHGAFLLSLQNISDPEKAIHNMSLHLIKNARMTIVINHPCFRIPRQSSWEEDPKQKLIYRRLNRYMTPMEIPIYMDKEKKKTTYSYHFSFSDLSDMLYENGFVIEKIEEWCGDKVSQGAKRKMENRARKEFPLFCAISALLLHKNKG